MGQLHRGICEYCILFQGGRPFATEEESHAMLDRFVALGGNFIDTADLYQVGLSETIVGKWLAK